MSAVVWPVFPGIDPKIEVQDNWGDADGDGSFQFKSVSGKKQFLTTWSSTRTIFRVTYNGLRTSVNAPSPYGSYSEVACVRYLFGLLKGSWDTFAFPDPITGSNVTVRFVSPTLRWTREETLGWYSCSFELEQDK
jgi:hypothetical protein